MLGGPECFFLLKWCNTVHSECPQIRYYLPENQLFSRLIFHNSKKYLPYQSSIEIEISMLARKQIHLDIQGAGVWGLPPRSRRNFLKKIKRNDGFSFKVKFFITFLQGSLDPQNYELAPQIPENNYQCSPAP